MNEPERPTDKFLSACGHRILAVTPGAPRSHIDSAAAEIGILIGALCKTLATAHQLTDFLVSHPLPRWNFEKLKRQADRFIDAVENPPPPPEPPTWCGFEIPDWAFSPHEWKRFESAVENELRRQIASWPPGRREEVEREVLRSMADYQACTAGAGPFQNPTRKQIDHYILVHAGREHQHQRENIGRPAPWTLIEELRPKSPDK